MLKSINILHICYKSIDILYICYKSINILYICYKSINISGFTINKTVSITRRSGRKIDLS